jgi:2-polyprenyl-3-methyl-5-hydroxy-6-metoxy-1,4-benzoquinol methylase
MSHVEVRASTVDAIETTENDLTGQVEQFLEVVAADVAAASGIAMAVLGDRLGLYRALAAAGPSTPSELAARTGYFERYIREWLLSQAAGDWVEYDEDSGTFTLPPAHAAVVAVEGSPAFLGGSVQTVSALFHSLDRLAAAFRSGAGIGWGEQHQDLHDGAARFFRTACQAQLPQWIELLDDVAERLRDGGRVADIGCGQGGAALTVAAAFDRAEVVGIDMHDISVERARAAAAGTGVHDRVSFRVADAADVDDGHFDLVMMLDSLHDMGDPVSAARGAWKALAPGGALLVVEPAASDRVAENFTPVGRTYYAASTAFCTPNALAQSGGHAMGSQAGPARLRDVLSQAGFTHVEVAVHTAFQMVLTARP